jgi:putative hydrolase of the HAD superfamily
MPRALLFDVGDVLMESNWVIMDELERRTGRRITGRGPLDPEHDRAWQRCLAGEIDVDEYWNEVARSGGYADRIAFWRAASDHLDRGVFAADALRLVDEAHAAGVKLGILSNDLYRASTREWVASRPEFAIFDALVDCTDFGERKPAPGPYLKAAADLGLPPEEIVFLDDTPYCIEGARAVGMMAVPVDPLNREHAFELARRLVGLAAPRPADELAARVEAAYRSADVGALFGMWHPDVVVRWNGVKVAEDQVAARRFFTGLLGNAASDVRLTVRAASGDTVAVEWESVADGRCGVELWTLRYGLIIDVCAYQRATQGG